MLDAFIGSLSGTLVAVLIVTWIVKSFLEKGMAEIRKIDEVEQDE